MAVKEQVVQAADRAATRSFAGLEKKTEQLILQSSRRGGLASSSHIRQERELCVEGYRDLCEAALNVVAEIEHEEAPLYLQAVRRVLLIHQHLVDRLFQHCAAPGQHSSLVGDGVQGELPAFRQALESTLEGLLADLEVGIVSGRSVASRKPSTGVSIDHAGQVMMNSPGGQQSVSGDLLVASGLDVKDLLSTLSALRGEIAKLPFADREAVEDAVVNVERELAAATPQPSRVRRLVGTVVDVGTRVGIGMAGGFLARLAEIAAGIVG